MCSLLHFSEEFYGLAINHPNVGTNMLIPGLAVCRLQSGQRNRFSSAN
jgi:hypothetical protein